MGLPTVLMTDVIRSTQQGESHGGAYLIDLERGRHEQVLDWDDVEIDWTGRGAGRGLRGIAFAEGLVWILASDELFAFDPSFRVVGSWGCGYLRHAHEMVHDAGVLYVTSTEYDSILEFDVANRAFVGGTWLEPVHAPELGPAGERVITGLRAHAFDPGGGDGPGRGDHLHLNNVSRVGGHTLFSGVRLAVLAGIDDGRVRPAASVPRWTHNARPYGSGVLFNSTAEESIVIAGRDGRVIRRLAVPRYAREDLEHADIPGDHARQAFGRGLCTTSDGLIIGGSSPSTVTAYDARSGRVLRSVNLTMDVRNTPHGLELWPY